MDQKVSITERIHQLKDFLGPRVWKLFLASTFAGVFLFGIEGLAVFVIQSFFVSIGITAAENTSLPSWMPNSLVFSCTLLICFGALKSVSQYANAYLKSATMMGFLRYHRSRILEMGIRNSPDFKPHEVNAVFTDLAGRASSAVSTVGNIILTSLVTLLLLALGLSMAPLLMMTATAILIAMLYPLRKLSQGSGKLGEISNQNWIAASQTLHDGMRNFLLLTIYSSVDQTVKTGQDQLANIEKANLEHFKIVGLKESLPYFLGILTITPVTIYSVTVLNFQGVALIAFYYVFLRFLQNCAVLNSSFGNLRNNWDALRRLRAWHNRFKEIQALSQSRKAELDARRKTKTSRPISRASNDISIAVKDLSFEYQPGQPLFKDLAFDVRPGESFLIQGESGVGKSTLISLILGLLEPTRGEATINGVDSTLVGPDLFDHIGYVGPEPFLISGSIAANLLYSHPHPDQVSEDQIWKALEVSLAKEFVEQLKDGLRTQINQNAKLSTGQKQRLAIARAILRNPKLLILDEGTSHLDTQTETQILEHLKAIQNQGVTNLYISHRDNYRAQVDRHLVLS